MPHKHNADRRHHIPKMAFKVRNWPEYEAVLRRRGSLTLLAGCEFQAPQKCRRLIMVYAISFIP
jgi:hypothetical protein